MGMSLLRSCLGPAYAAHRGNVTVLFPAEIVFKPHVIALVVHEPRLPISRVILWIVNRDDDLELARADLSNPFHCAHLVGVRCAGGVNEGFVVEARRLDHQRIAFEVTYGMAVVERERD